MKSNLRCDAKFSADSGLVRLGLRLPANNARTSALLHSIALSVFAEVMCVVVEFNDGDDPAVVAPLRRCASKSTIFCENMLRRLK